ncbi:MAG TPA: tripartite tricarboxylate transporter substrate binding protein [Xanthobacteraceae bacterium]|nr:tripartite tricarboxylate transporter substrate binding protein [Xanthobacteraceae bacterium]
MNFRVVCAAAALAAIVHPASAQQYPSQPVRIVVPFSAGSNTDAQARILADKLSQMWKQQVIVENRPGIAGTASVAKSPADGYTLMLTSSGHPVANVISPTAPFDPVKDFAGVTQVSAVSASFVVPVELPANNLKEFIALAQQSPGKMNFGSAGTASTSYLAGEIFKQIANVNLVHVPYKGAPEALNSIMRNDTQVYFASTTFSPDLITAKKIKVLAVSSAKRAPRLPEVPTAAEAGVPEYVYDSWFGVMAPAGTPAAILNKVSADIASALKLPDVVKAVDTQGLVVVTQTPAAFDKLIASEASRYGKILREAGVGKN